MPNEKRQEAAEQWRQLARKELIASADDYITRLAVDQMTAKNPDERAEADNLLARINPEMLKAAPEALRVYRAIEARRADGAPVSFADIQTPENGEYVKRIAAGAETTAGQAVEQLQQAYIRFLPFTAADEIAATLAGGKGSIETIERIAAEHRAIQDTIEQQRNFKTAADEMAELEAFLNDPEQRHRKTGFEALDAALSGGIWPGLFVLSAGSSAGKTAFALQIAQQMAQNGEPVLYFSLEMSRFELMARLISAETYLASFTNARTAKEQQLNRWSQTEILTGKRYDKDTSERSQKALEYGKAIFASYAQNITIREGVGVFSVADIAETTRAYIRQTGQRPTIVIDYLQILRPVDPRNSDKQNMDYTAMALKQLSRDERVPIFAISSISRAEYWTEKTIASAKDSGGVEYAADVVFSLDIAGREEINPDTKGAKRESLKLDKASKSKADADIILAIHKNRRGAGEARFSAVWHKAYNHFAQLQREEMEY